MKYDGHVRVSGLDWISLVLVIIGALTWGLVGIGGFIEANWNVVNLIFGSMPGLENLIYLLMGLAGLYELYVAYQLYGAGVETEPTHKTAD
jgi:uncharacterized membrane protein YuzA (DUF378 family)